MSGLPKQMALKAGIPAASLIPDSAPLFLGFTSSQRAALGPDLIANFETLPGLTDQWPGGYFRRGTTMHVSHLYLDLENWYRRFSFTDRVWATFTPNLDAPDGTRTVPEGAQDVATFEAHPHRRRHPRLHRPLGGDAARDSVAGRRRGATTAPSTRRERR